jgi:hypothetical protein
VLTNRPILTPKTVLPVFFAVGILFAPIGGLLLWASAQVQEIVIDYTDCRLQPNTSTYSAVPDNKVTQFFKSSDITKPMWAANSIKMNYGADDVDTQVCSLQFSIPEDLHPPVLMYYRLTNFYQNHRRYVKSLDTDQLKGNALSNSTVDGSSCDPIKLDKATGKAIYPCGLIANSVFNDTFASPVSVGSNTTNMTYSMTDKGIAWSADKKLYQKTKYDPSQVVPPPNWMLRYPNGYNATNLFNANEDEAFIVWMRTAGLPTFSKLARRNDDDVMKAGNYKVDITMNFPVDKYSGTKSLVITTRTVMGGRNPFLGIAYVVVAGICVLLGILFLAAHLVKPRYVTTNLNKC